MNKKQLIIEEKKLLDQIKHSSRFATREGCIKCWRNVTFDHFITMASICWKLANSGFKIYTEAEFVNSGRADIIAISGKCGYIIEVLCTESEAMFSEKKNYYPEDFTIVPVRTKDFNIDDFCL